MGRKAKYNKEIKISAIKDYINGIKSLKRISSELSCCEYEISKWAKKYHVYGENVFNGSVRNKAYTKEFKLDMIKKYLSGEGSYDELTLKYNIDIEIKDYNPKGNVYIAKTRKVNKDEKFEIIQWTIVNNYQYKLAAEKFETHMPKFLDGLKIIRKTEKIH